MGDSKNHQKTACVIRQAFYPQDPRVYKEVAVWVEKGWRVDVVCLRGKSEPKFETIGNVTVHRLQREMVRAGKIQYILQYFTFLLRCFLKVSRLSLKNRYQFIQINTMPDILVFSALLAKFQGVPIILDMHEVMPELFKCIYKISDDNVYIRTLKLFEKISTSFANHVITVNNQCLKIFLSRGLPVQKSSIVINVPDNTVFRSPEESWNTNSINNESLRLFSHGSMLERYGFQTLIEALALLKDRYPNVQLDLLGDGEYRQALVELSQKLNIRDRVHFHGYIPLKQVPGHIRSSDICVVPLIKDIYTDIMLPNKIFEYVALKKPVVSSDVEAIQSFFPADEITYYRSGNAKDMADAIDGMLRRWDRTSQMVEKAYHRYTDFTWDKHKTVYYQAVMETIRDFKLQHRRA
jgi:glycosyltransferase involved in cell wall biosynthesis